ncbi:MAG: hypothetical protein IKF14_03675 [Atopobiaceae bacterium]|nr:hypothetical protein [Atopobiaceae bacterium]
MANHFREDVGKTAVAPRRQTTMRRAAYVERDSGDGYYPYAEEPVVRGGICALGRGLFLLIAWAARLAALALFVIVMLNSMPIPPIRYYVSTVTEFITSYLPWHEFGTLSVDTPFGGVFRCDLCLVSLLLFVIDWVACRIRAALV